MFDVSTMNNLETVFFYMAMVSTGNLAIQVVLMLAGFADFDADFDGADSSFDDSVGFKLFSLKGLNAFFSGLGWGGLMATREFELDSVFFTVIISVFLGFLMMFLYAYTVYLVSKLHAPNNESPTDAVGSTGSVYLEIPESGVGKVTLDFNGRVVTTNARSADGMSIPTNSIIKVDSFEDGVMVVSKVN
jgi:hypothetical protein